MNILLPEIDRGGNDVVLIKNLTKSFSRTNGEELTVFENFSTTINSKPKKLAVVGVNGGKINSSSSNYYWELEASHGSAVLGPSIKAGYFGKSSMDSLISENNLTEELTRLLPHASDGLIRNILAAFLFKGDDVYKKFGILVGEKKRDWFLLGS